MKISNYPEVEALREDDLLVISRPGEGTKSVSIAALAELLAAGIGNAVANNLNVTEEGYILDARQGKVLGDRFNYSTDEQVVGKWIDGKTVYRKILQFNPSTFTANSWTIVATDQVFGDIDILINSYGTFQRHTGSDIHSYPIFYLNIEPSSFNYTSAIYISKSGKTLSFRLGSSWASLVSQLKKAVLIIEYTKTTD